VVLAEMQALRAQMQGSQSALADVLMSGDAAAVGSFFNQLDSVTGSLRAELDNVR
jgi:hypothetical protein